MISNDTIKTYLMMKGKYGCKSCLNCGGFGVDLETTGSIFFSNCLAKGAIVGTVTKADCKEWEWDGNTK